MKGLLKKKALAVAAAAILAYGCSDSWYQLMLIQGQSMYPSYHNLQFVILEKRFGDLKAGEVVAFRCEGLDALLVKRVVAVPGDTVRIADGILYVNGVADAGTQHRGDIAYPGIVQETLTLSDGMYFVLGDNFSCSRDSRYEEVGCVSYSSIVGRVHPQK